MKIIDGGWKDGEENVVADVANILFKGARDGSIVGISGIVFRSDGDSAAFAIGKYDAYQAMGLLDSLKLEILEREKSDQ